MASTAAPAALQRPQCFSLHTAGKPDSGIFLPSRLSHVLNRRSFWTSCKLGSPKSRTGRTSRTLRCDGYSSTKFDQENELFDGGCYQHWEATEIIQRKANRIEIPHSLRIIKKKKQWMEKVVPEEAIEDGCCLRKCLSSLLSIVHLLHNSLRRRTVILHRNAEQRPCQVETDLHFSFLWIFQKIFSKSPGMLVDLMLLLASFTVSATPDPATGLQATPVDHKQIEELNEELNLQNAMDEVTNDGRNQEEERIDQFVPVLRVNLEPDNYMEYLNTDLVYQMNLACEPNNSLLLSNYAQFLHLVSHSYDRAEEYFKKAIEVEPGDAEAMGRYANFLWLVRKDVSEAEDMYQKAIEAQPESSYHAASYANFLWSSGGEETCFLQPSR